MNSNTTLSPQDTTAIQTVAAAPPPTGPQQVPELSPYQAFLFRQSMRITARGGSMGDVADYIQHAEQHHIKSAVAPKYGDAEMPGMVRGLSQQVLQGATFGFGDEALGTLYGFLSGEGGQAGRDLYRAEIAMFTDAHKKSAILAQLVGAGALGPLGILGRGAGIGGKIAGAVVGGAAAATQGAGDQPGDLSARAKAALMAAPFGAAAGVAAPAVAKYAGVAIASMFNKVGPAVQPFFRQLMARLPGSPAFAARQLLNEALAKDGLSVLSASGRVEQRALMGLPTTLADVGGDHTLELARVAQGFRTPAQQALVSQLTARQADQGARLLAAIGTGSRLGLHNAFDLADQLMAQQIAQAQPLYNQAFAQMVPMSNPLRKLLATPIFQEAYNTGRATSMLEDAAKLRRGLAMPALPEDLKDIAQLPVRAFDYMKRGLDHLIEQSGKEGRPPLSRQTATALRARLNVALADVGKKVPVYQQARDTWRGFAEKLDAIQLGNEGFLTKAPEVIAKELATSAAPEYYKIGAIQKLADGVHGIGPENANIAQRFFGARLFGVQDRTDAARLRVLFPDAATAEDFMDRVAGEAASTRVLRKLATGGPREGAATQNLVPATGTMQRVMEKTGMRGPQTERGRAIANEITMLFTKGLDDPNELVAMLRSLEKVQRFGEGVTAGLRVAGGEAGAKLQQP